MKSSDRMSLWMILTRMWLGKDNQGQEDSSYGRLLLMELSKEY
jgi:hypothetical protein